MAEIFFSKKAVDMAARNIEKQKNIRQRISTDIEKGVKLAFYEWANKHTGGARIVDKEWNRFQKVLQRYL